MPGGKVWTAERLRPLLAKHREAQALAQAQARRRVGQKAEVDRFAGDGILVFFNDPVAQPDHETRAVRMAVAMRDRFEALNVAWRKRGYDLGFGVGMAVGHATLGRIGFEGRYDYAAIGTVVIMASRLCSEARPGQILVNQRGYSAIEELVHGEPVGELTLKGFSRPATAYNVVGLAPAP